MRTVLSLAVALSLALNVHAHDPYEITSVAYVHSDRIEMFIEMEFPAGMRLAGQKSERDVAIVSQFESALPRLRDLAGSFFRLTAGNNALYPISTNVELGVEDHIKFKIEYPATAFRPLRFVADGLGANTENNPYGTSLTVLDMVNQKVLGQTTLFANQPQSEFPTAPKTDPAPASPSGSNPPSPIADAKPATPVADTSPVSREIPIEPKTKPNLVVLMTLLGAGLILGFTLLPRKK